MDTRWKCERPGFWVFGNWAVLRAGNRSDRWSIRTRSEEDPPEWIPLRHPDLFEDECYWRSLQEAKNAVARILVNLFERREELYDVARVLDEGKSWQQVRREKIRLVKGRGSE